MKKILIPILLALLTFASCGKKTKTVKFSNEKDSISYFIGLQMARQLQMSIKANYDYIKIDPEIISKAFKEVFSGDSIKITDMQVDAAIQKYIMRKQGEVASKNLKEGQEFLEKNKKNPGVVTLPSGLQYQELKRGTGPMPDSSSVVNVHYTGTLINGEKFESTIGNQPAKFPVLGVIKGWTEALLKMNVGSKWKVFIPTELAYGQNVRPGGPIKANMALIFEMELLSIEPKAKEEPKPQVPGMKK